MSISWNKYKIGRSYCIAWSILHSF